VGTFVHSGMRDRVIEGKRLIQSGERTVKNVAVVAHKPARGSKRRASHPLRQEDNVRSICPIMMMAATLIVFPATASAGASKEVVFDKTEGICASGLTSGTPTDSFAVVNTHAGNVSAEVSLKGLAPNTTYQVDLVQTPSGESCVQVPRETSLTTNGQGNGNAHWSESIQSEQTGVFVMVIAPEFSDFLVTPTVPLS
jgi:hypothetical protein